MAGASKVVILGGGFAGLHLAAQLEAQGATGRDLAVTLVAREPYCTLTPLLFDLLTGALPPEHCIKPFDQVLRATTIAIGEVVDVDLEARHVSLETGESLPYDQLVLALGGVADCRGIEGAGRAYAFKSLEDAIVLRERVCRELAGDRPEPPAFAVVGGGLLGVELAAELGAMLAERAPESAPPLALVAGTERILPEQGPAMAEYALQALVRRGVDVFLGAPAAAVEPGAVRLQGGRAVPADVVVVAAGVAPHPLLARLELLGDRRGRVRVLPTLRTPTHPEVWALGDCAAVPGPEGRAPALAQHAVRQAELLAYNLQAALCRAPLRAYDYRTRGVMATLGPRDAVAELQGWTVWGEPVWWARRAFYTWALPSQGDRLGMLGDWTLDALRHPWQLPSLLAGLRPPAAAPSPAPMRVTWVSETARSAGE